MVGCNCGTASRPLDRRSALAAARYGALPAVARRLHQGLARVRARASLRGRAARLGRRPHRLHHRWLPLWRQELLSGGWLLGPHRAGAQPACPTRRRRVAARAAGASAGAEDQAHLAIVPSSDKARRWHTGLLSVASCGIGLLRAPQGVGTMPLARKRAWWLLRQDQHGDRQRTGKWRQSVTHDRPEQERPVRKGRGGLSHGDGE